MLAEGYFNQNGGLNCTLNLTLNGLDRKQKIASYRYRNKADGENVLRVMDSALRYDSQQNTQSKVGSNSSHKTE